MTWRDRDEEDDGDYGEILRAVLEHYGVRLRDRDVQMVHCPLGHEDRNPSCSVNLSRGIWKCHSCGNEGGVFRLIELKEGVAGGRARAIAADIAKSEGSPGNGGGTIRGSSYAGGRSVPAPQRDQRRGDSYRPSWRR